MILRILFLIFSNADIQFAKKELTSKFYTTAKALPTFYQAELINKKEFAKAALNEDIKIFLVYVASLTLKITIHLAREAQIVLFITEKVTVPAKYLDFADVFSKKLAEVLPERTDINKHAIKLVDGKQLSYRPIYNLGPVEFQTLKTYIKTNVTNDFI